MIWDKSFFWKRDEWMCECEKLCEGWERKQEKICLEEFWKELIINWFLKM